MIRVRCVVERITFQSPETGYAVLKVRMKDYRDPVPVVGNFIDINVGCVLTLEGNWKTDAKYGRQFAAEKWEETLPATAYGIEKYLGSGLVKGIGPQYAKRIVAAFGADTIAVIDETPERLLEVPGLGRKRVDKIRESWAAQKEIKNIMLFLQSHDVSTAHAARIYKTYGNDAIQVVRNNPYRLADDIWGIGFKTADQIAQKLGFDAQSPERCRSGILYSLNELANAGHVFACREQLIRDSATRLEVPEELAASALDAMIASQDVILEDGAIYLPPFCYAERGVATRLLALDAPIERRAPLTVDLEHIEALSHIAYDEVQQDAIRTAAQAKVMVLTGGPGTGKTTTTQGIIAMLRDNGLSIRLAAPTGRAAKRMTEATGRTAKTIHRLLEFKPPEGYQRNEQNPLEGDALIIDEASMIDIVLMNSLVKAIPSHMRLILVGDIDQLPSVGAGNVLRDIIDSQRFPVVRLTRIFRQAQSSRIIMNAHRINRGQMPEIRNSTDSDFFFLEDEDPQHVAETIVDLVRRRLPARYHVDPRSIQVLTPMQRGVVGAANLNLLLQQALNPREECLRRSGTTFKLDDRVMQIKNNYEKEVFNGDIGLVTALSLTEHELTVTFDDRPVTYDISELDELVHAYACTIHKSQGSEYPVVVMPLLMSHYVMLQRNLLYTGITRAKKLLVLIGTKKAVSYAVRNVTVTARNTRLRERLALPSAERAFPTAPEMPAPV